MKLNNRNLNDNLIYFQRTISYISNDTFNLAPQESLKRSNLVSKKVFKQVSERVSKQVSKKVSNQIPKRVNEQVSMKVSGQVSK